MKQDPLLDISPLGSPWQTLDPFLFCAHHDDAYPAGDAAMGPAESLAGRAIGQDFSGKDGWSMYHGRHVPGFPQHPHRGFETVTLARRGFIDHADSMGASARFGEGDVQWMTAGRGIVHSEMFPLTRQDDGNHTELFQIWLNLPARNKMVESHFAMFWHDRIPEQTVSGTGGGETTLVSYAGALPDGQMPPAPPPASWAADAGNQVVIWTIKMTANAVWTLPATDPASSRRLFFFQGQDLRLLDQTVEVGQAITLAAGAEIELKNGPAESELLLLQGRPIGEPVAQHGPFVMNSAEEIRQAMIDYQSDQFGGWQWPDEGPVHARDRARFAQYPDGRIETADD